MSMIMAPFSDDRLAYVLACLCDEDRVELDAAGIEDPMTVFSMSGHAAPYAACLLDDAGMPCAVFGASPGGDGFGIPWAITTPEFRRHPRAAMNASITHMDCMKACFPRLVNMVHRGHSYALRWLPRLGFKVHTDKPIGPGGEFFLFDWSAGNV